MIEQLAIAGYRSIRSLIVHLGQLNVVTGPNGSGKSNLYRSLRLLADAANGQLIRSLAREGGLDSTLWAGPEHVTAEMRSGEQPIQGTLRKKPISLRLGFLAEPLSYCLDLGIPQPSPSMFRRDPELKRECLWHGNRMSPRTLCADRRNHRLRCRNEQGAWQDIDIRLSARASMLSEYAEPRTAPELIVLRDTIRSWRFYETFRTDADAPARRVSVGTFTPVLSNDGSDLAAAFQTIREIGDGPALHRAVDDAFPGSEVLITQSDLGMQLALRQPGMLRDLGAAELSDGTLRFLLLLAALLTPRPPELMVLNEPETSLHPELLPALGRLINTASQQCQLVVVTHHPRLVAQLDEDASCRAIRLQKVAGETLLEDSSLLQQCGWQWPAR